MPHPQARRVAHLSSARSFGRRWRSYVGVVAVTGAAFAVLGLAPVPQLGTGYMGFVLGGAVMLVALCVVGMNSPRQDGHLSGQWSIDGLRKMRGWKVIDDLPFRNMKVDHVIVAPAGVLAVETRCHPRGGHSADTMEQDRRDLDAARRAARKVRLFLDSAASPRDAKVTPVLLVWGPGAPELPGGHRLQDGVYLLDGNYPRLWMHLFNAPRLSIGARDSLSEMFHGYVREQAAIESGRRPRLLGEVWAAIREGAAAERTARATRQLQLSALRQRHHVPVIGPGPTPTRVSRAAR